MARFNMELPADVMKDFQFINDNAEEIFGEMVKAGAGVAESNIRANIPDGIRNSPMMNNLIVTKVYKTPSDDGINCKIMFSGYFTNSNGQRVPAPLVANVFEYGRSNAPFPKQPFLRKSFRKGQIEAAMRAAQVKASGGLLE